MHLAAHPVNWLCHRKGSFVHWAGSWIPGSSVPPKILSEPWQIISVCTNKPLGSVDPAGRFWSGKGCATGLEKMMSSLFWSLLLLSLSWGSVGWAQPWDQCCSHSVSPSQVLSFPWDPHPSHQGATCEQQLLLFPTSLQTTQPGFAKPLKACLKGELSAFS